MKFMKRDHSNQKKKMTTIGEEKPVIEIVEDDEISLILTPISCRGTTKKNAISVEQYAEDKDLYLSIKASFLQSYSQVVPIDLGDDHDTDDLQILRVNPSKRRKMLSSPSFTETGQSSNSKPDRPSTFTCEICADLKSLTESFAINGCSHFYCSECMIKYVASKLQDNVSQISCPVPNCKGVLEPYQCRTILPPDVFDRWGDALCEALILGSEKFYCPYKDCSALLIRDGVVVRESECPYCRRLFCAQCEAPWHSDIDCEEFQKLSQDEREREDILMMKLAKTKNWKRCDKCKFFVEKSYGCMYVRCRCGHAFCYNCGTPSTGHSHMCANCKH